VKGDTRDATVLDVALLSGVVGLAKHAPGAHSPKLAASLVAFDSVLSAGKVAQGAVSDRLVRAAFSALERVTPQLRTDMVPNPLPPPHNLSWYFCACACPLEVRAFATALRRKHTRVWSVARAENGWLILMQVFGATSKADAEKTAALECQMPAKRLRQYAVGTVKSFGDFKPRAIEEFMHEHARGLLQRESLGDFVEISLLSRYG